MGLELVACGFGVFFENKVNFLLHLSSASLVANIFSFSAVFDICQISFLAAFIFFSFLYGGSTSMS